jgi:hypothetical protein
MRMATRTSRIFRGTDAITARSVVAEFTGLLVLMWASSAASLAIPICLLPCMGCDAAPRFQRLRIPAKGRARVGAPDGLRGARQATYCIEDGSRPRVVLPELAYLGTAARKDDSKCHAQQGSSSTGAK